MLPWETDSSLRGTELGAEFAEVWSGLPKVVFSRTLGNVWGNAKLADSSVAEEVATALGATDKDVEIGGATLAAAAIELGLVGRVARGNLTPGLPQNRLCGIPHNPFYA